MKPQMTFKACFINLAAPNQLVWKQRSEKKTKLLLIYIVRKSFILELKKMQQMKTKMKSKSQVFLQPDVLREG